MENNIEIIVIPEVKKTFEECLPEIDILIDRKKFKWTLKAIAYLDWEDVAQIIRFHLWKKWHLYDSSKGPVGPWVNTVIGSQFKNLLRNLYYSKAKPCSSCPFSEGDNLCGFTKSHIQDETCNVFAKWFKSKKDSYNVNLPVSSEFHSNELSERTDDSFDLTQATINLNEKLEKVLTKSEFKAYNLIFVECLSDTEVAKKLGFKTSERGRPAGYARIMQLKKIIFEKAQKAVKEIDLS